MTKQMEAFLMIAKNPVIWSIMEPIIDLKNESVFFDRLSVGVLSGGQKAAVSWCWCIWNDRQIPEQKSEDWRASKEEGWRDPLEGFGVMNRELQIAVLNALAHRHDTLQPPGKLETFLKNLGKQMEENES